MTITRKISDQKQKTAMNFHSSFLHSIYQGYSIIQLIIFQFQLSFLLALHWIRNEPRLHLYG